MAAGAGPGADALSGLDGLARSPEAHHLFHALRVLEAAHADRPRLGESRRPREDAVRLGQEAELAFPPSTLRAFAPAEGGRPARLTNRFFGLFGPHGPLPLHLTEYARDRQRNAGDETLVAFADMLTHRLMGLLYRAWAAGQPAPGFDRPGADPFERKVAAVAGFHGAALRGRDAMPDLARRHFAGLLSQGARHPEGLVAILGAFFDAPVRLEQFVGAWLPLEPGDRWRLGARAGLGRTTSIGTRVWSRAAKFRLRVGPLGREAYERLLPGGASLARLTAIVRTYAGDALDWDVNLVMRADDVPRARLGGTTRLGQTSWIGTRAVGRDADDLFLAPALGAPAPEDIAT